MEKIKLGSIYFEGRAVEPATGSHLARYISLEDTVPGKELEWVKDGKTLVAACCACTCISWETLSWLGYITGHPVRIDGKPYLCRSLTVGVTYKDKSEWDNLLDRFGPSNKLWHWKDCFFWGQEADPKNPGTRMMRGGTIAARSRLAAPAFSDDETTGFRPVLEELPPEPELTPALTGTTLKVYGPRGHVLDGQVVGVDDYDLVLRNPVNQLCGRENGWAVQRENEISISRKEIIWLEEKK